MTRISSRTTFFYKRIFPTMRPNRVVLSLREATVFGKEIAFAAPIVWIPFAKSPIIEDLSRRIDVARGS
jgi:hypothetical protein